MGIFNLTNQIFRIWYVLVLLVVIAFPIVAKSSPVLWDKASGGNNHFYDVILVGTPLSWDDARSAAQAIGPNWDLATITTSAENDFVKGLFANDPSFFNTFAFPGVSNRSGPWIGAFDVLGSTNFQWVTGEPVTFTDWGPSEPFGNGQTVSYTDFSSPFGDGIAIAWNDIGPELREDGPIAYIAEGQNLCLAPVAGTYEVQYKRKFKIKGLGKDNWEGSDQLILNDDGSWIFGEATGTYSCDKKGKKIKLKLDESGLDELEDYFAEIISDIALDKGTNLEPGEITVIIKKAKIAPIKIDKKKGEPKGKVQIVVTGKANAELDGKQKQGKFSYKGKGKINSVAASDDNSVD